MKSLPPRHTHWSYRCGKQELFTEEILPFSLVQHWIHLSQLLFPLWALVLQGGQRLFLYKQSPGLVCAWLQMHTAALDDEDLPNYNPNNHPSGIPLPCAQEKSGVQLNWFSQEAWNAHDLKLCKNKLHKYPSGWHRADPACIRGWTRLPAPYHLFKLHFLQFFWHVNLGSVFKTKQNKNISKLTSLYMHSKQKCKQLHI